MLDVRQIVRRLCHIQSIGCSAGVWSKLLPCNFLVSVFCIPGTRKNKLPCKLFLPTYHVLSFSSVNVVVLARGYFHLRIELSFWLSGKINWIRCMCGYPLVLSQNMSLFLAHLPELYVLHLFRWGNCRYRHGTCMSIWTHFYFRCTDSTGVLISP